MAQHADTEQDGLPITHAHDEYYARPYRRNPAKSESLVTTNRPGRVERLDGIWHYHPDLYDTALRKEWFTEEQGRKQGRSNEVPTPWDADFDHWPEMRLPATWNVQDPSLFYYEEPVVFTRKFHFRRGDEERVLLRFNAVAYGAAVFLNGSYVGCHEGASTPFVVDVTDVVQTDNRIVVLVENRRSRYRVPMSDTDWYNYGGIHRSIDILRLPKAYIRDFTVGLLPDGSFSKIFCEVSVAGVEKPDLELKPSTARVEIPELDLSVEVPLQNGMGRVEVEASPELWSPQNPRLYHVAATFGKDRVVDTVGFREIRVQGNDILLNGEPVFLRGVSMHEDSVEHGRTLTEEEIYENFSLVKELGGNFARLAHYPHNGAAARMADEMGLLLWEEVPVYWGIAFSNPDTYADAENQLSELILRDRNRASVVIWSVGNENPDTDERLSFMSRLAARARELDGTRLISAACLVNHRTNRIDDRLERHLDVIGINQYMGWYQPDFSKLGDLLENSTPDRPVILSEFGGGAVAGHHGSRDELFTEENQAWIYQRQVDVIDAISYVKGMSPWILYDFRSPKRLNRFQRGYNRKGLVSEDKSRRKAAFFVLQRFYREAAGS